MNNSNQIIIVDNFSFGWCFSFPKLTEVLVLVTKILYVFYKIYSIMGFLIFCSCKSVVFDYFLQLIWDVFSSDMINSIFCRMQVEVSKYTEGINDKALRPNGLPRSLIRYDGKPI